MNTLPQELFELVLVKLDFEDIISLVECDTNMMLKVYWARPLLEKTYNNGKTRYMLLHFPFPSNVPKEFPGRRVFDEKYNLISQLREFIYDIKGKINMRVLNEVLNTQFSLAGYLPLVDSLALACS